MDSPKINSKVKTIKFDLINAKRPEYHFKKVLKSKNLVGIALDPVELEIKLGLLGEDFIQILMVISFSHAWMKFLQHF